MVGLVRPVCPSSIGDERLIFCSVPRRRMFRQAQHEDFHEILICPSKRNTSSSACRKMGDDDRPLRAAFNLTPCCVYRKQR